ncbi:MAG: glycosyltransferase family 2 protein, partial [Sphingobacteriales bacterium]
MNKHYSFIILTYNEETHLPRLLNSIKGLKAKVYIVDSFSTDSTLEIARAYGAEVFQNKFINHPLQWKFALDKIVINTPWTIGLDADQIVTPELYNLLLNFEDDPNDEINGIYFNRKNIFRGKWIRFGGFYP